MAGGRGKSGGREASGRVLGASGGSAMARGASGVLVSYAGFPRMLNYFLPDNGLASLAGALRSAGHDVWIHDVQVPLALSRYVSTDMRKEIRKLNDGGGRGTPFSVAESVETLRDLDAKLGERELAVQDELIEQLNRAIRLRRVDFVGFKLWRHPGFRGSIRIAQALRARFPEIKFFAGGPHVAIYHEALCREELPFDAVVLGDGERVLPMLAEFAIGERTLESVGRIKTCGRGRTAVVEPDHVPLECLPSACYTPEVYPALSHSQKIKVLVVDDARGCNNRCPFCIHPVKSGPLRNRPVGRLLNDLLVYKQTVGSTSYRLAGSVPSRHTVAWVSQARQLLGSPIAFSAFVDIQSSADLGSFLSASNGCRAVSIGMETGSEELRWKQFGKRYANAELIGFVEKARSQGVFVVVSIIFPAPFETADSTRATFDLLQRLHPDSVLIMPPFLDPGTAWGREPQRWGFSTEGVDLGNLMMNREYPAYSPPELDLKDGYRIGQRSLAQAFVEAGEFARSVMRSGILVGVSDDQALLAFLAGYAGREGEFDVLVRRSLLAGDSDAISRIVQRINATVERRAIADAEDEGGMVHTPRARVTVAAGGGS